MIKKILTISTMACSFLFVQPCYSMFSLCCDEDEEERKILIPVPSTLNTSIQQQSEYHRGKDAGIQKDNEKKDEKNAISERQIRARDGKIIEFPKDLIVVSNTDGSRSLILKNIFQIQIFPDYDDAVKKNSDVDFLHKLNAPVNTRDSITRRMNFFCDDVWEKVEENDKSVSENVISCIKIVFDQLPGEGPFPIKFHYQKETTTSLILIRIDDGALFVKGPAKKNDSI